jgi:hypothetical protein
MEEGRAGADRTQDDTTLATGYAPLVASPANFLRDTLGCKRIAYSLASGGIICAYCPW